MLLKIALAFSRRGWLRTSSALLELDCTLSGLGRTARRIKREQKRRRAAPHAFTSMEGSFHA